MLTKAAARRALSTAAAGQWRGTTSRPPGAPLRPPLTTHPVDSCTTATRSPRPQPTAQSHRAPLLHPCRAFRNTLALCTALNGDAAGWRTDGGARSFSPRARVGRGGASASARPAAGSGSGEEQLALGVDVEGDVGAALRDSGLDLETLLEAVEADAEEAVRQALAMEGGVGSEHDGAELSVTLCSDGVITELNREWLGKDYPTDVLSFPGGWEEQPKGYPLRVLGDIFISLDTAKLQAADVGASLRDEVRVLLVHGVFHLLGYDHELGRAQMLEMAEKEVECFRALGWSGRGLITRVEEEAGGNGVPDAAESSGSSEDSSELFAACGDIRLLAIDMDGTLLNSASRVSAATAEALRGALARGLRVVLATGKARPAAVAALGAVGLAGEGGVVSDSQPWRVPAGSGGLRRLGPAAAQRLAAAARCGALL
eukprot:jgi/Tetstr1/440414/TSEL_028748.t1